MTVAEHTYVLSISLIPPPIVTLTRADTKEGERAALARSGELLNAYGASWNGGMEGLRRRRRWRRRGQYGQWLVGARERRGKWFFPPMGDRAAHT